MSYKICPKCQGKGVYVDFFLSHTCDHCEGKGKIEDFQASEDNQINYLQAELDEIVDELAIAQEMLLRLEKELQQKELYCQDLEKELDNSDDAMEELIQENKDLKKKLGQTPAYYKKPSANGAVHKCSP